MTKAPSGPKTAPPPPRTKGSSIPPPLADTVEEVEEAELDESAYDSEGDDFSMGMAGHKDSMTEIGGPPTRDSVQTDPVGAYPPSRGGKRKPEDEW